jgi:hypothetical protein
MAVHGQQELRDDGFVMSILGCGHARVADGGGALGPHHGWGIIGKAWQLGTIDATWS